MIKTLIGAAALFAAPAAFAQDVPQSTPPADQTAPTPPAPEPDRDDPATTSAPAPDATAPTRPDDAAPPANADDAHKEHQKKDKKKPDPRG